MLDTHRLKYTKSRMRLTSCLTMTLPCIIQRAMYYLNDLNAKTQKIIRSDAYETAYAPSLNDSRASWDLCID
jgi:hypothetical protein